VLAFALTLALVALGVLALTVGRTRRAIDAVCTSLASLRTEQQRALAVVRVEAERSARLRRD
jgi:hypothetical protein